MRIFVTIILLFVFSLKAQAFELIIEKVTNNVYALVGEIGPRRYENHALNNTMGFIITPEGVVLIGSGASPSGARLIEKAIAKVTSQPVRWLVNIAAQDHHWLGNSYFLAKGADIIALERTVLSQKTHVNDYLLRLKKVVKKQADEVLPMYASKIIKSNHKKLIFGNIEAELLWLGGGHFSDDTVLWLPKQRVVFAGNLVFHDRMLDINNFTPVTPWLTSFNMMASLNPKYVIPGHGHTGDLSQAKRDTGNYLAFLIKGVRSSLDNWLEMGETIDTMTYAPSFKHLQFYDDWHRHNINRTYLELEAAQ